MTKSIGNFTYIAFLNEKYESKEGFTYALGINIAPKLSYVPVQYCYDCTGSDCMGIIVALVEPCHDSIISDQGCGIYKTNKLKAIEFMHISDFINRIDITIAAKILEFNTHKGAWMFSHKYIRHYAIKQEIINKCIAEFPHILKYLPYVYKTKEVCSIAVIKEPHSMLHVPENLKTQQMCHFAVHKCPDVYFHVPEQWKTKEMCDYATKIWYNSRKRITYTNEH